MAGDEEDAAAAAAVGDGDVVTAKATAMAVLCCASLAMGLVPLLLARRLGWTKASSSTATGAKDNGYVSALLALGGGVLLCTTFVHLEPEVAESVAELAEEGRLPDLPFPLAPLLMCVGFFAMYLVEELVHVYMHRLQARRRSSAVGHVLQRTLSIRRSQREPEGAAASKDLEQARSQSHGHGHGHSHSAVAIVSSGSEEEEDEPALVAGLRGLLVVLALSVHELFEGLAVGLESSASAVWYMFGAVSAHKLVIAFCIGVELVTSGTRPLLTVAYVALFAVVSPIGIGIGLGLTHSGAGPAMDVASVFLQGLASGTLLYVVFFEILQRERVEGLKHFLSALAGFAIMFGLQFLSHEHGHSHVHSHDRVHDHDKHRHFYTA